jgi:hypothetical protein
MHKIIITFKENMVDILISFSIFSLIVVLVIASASANQDTLSKTTVCREIGQGNYQHLNQLLKPSSSLKDVKLNDKGGPSYTGQQSMELATIYTECGFRIMPFIGEIISTHEYFDEAFENIYKIFQKLKSS